MKHRTGTKKKPTTLCVGVFLWSLQTVSDSPLQPRRFESCIIRLRVHVQNALSVLGSAIAVV